MTIKMMEKMMVVMVMVISINIVTSNENQHAFHYDNKKNNNKEYNNNKKYNKELCPHKCICTHKQIQRDDTTITTTIITNVTCSSIALTTIPEALPNHVVHLDLSGNFIKNLNSNTNSNLFENLIFLNLSHNQLRSVKGGFFNKLKKLKVLDLSHNRLNKLDSSVFSEVSNQDNMMVNDGYIDPSYIVKDDDDDVEEEEEEDEDDVGVISVRRSLEQLWLNGNRLKGVDGVFEGMVKLNKVFLHENNLKSISDSTFKDCRSLQFISISHNNISSIQSQAFAHNRKLSNLQLKHNPGLHHVTNLNLTSCRHLNYLDLSHCHLTTTHFLHLPPSLRYLQLRNNKLTEIDRQTFSSVTGLNILLLDGNKISKIQDDVFSGMLFLQQLWLSDNNLESFPVQLPASLNRLLLDNNKIQHWPDGTFDVGADDDDTKINKNNNKNKNNKPLVQLNSLSISTNQLSHLNIHSLALMNKLSYLDASENLLTQLYDNTFEHNQQLKTLNLNKNPINIISNELFNGIKKLEELSLSYVQSDKQGMEVTASFLAPLKNSLKSLEVNYSPLVIEGIIRAGGDTDGVIENKSNIQNNNSFNVFTLNEMSKMQKLEMLGSKLTSISEQEITTLIAPSLKQIKLGSSKWWCDRDIVGLKTFLTSKKGINLVRKASKIVCAGPRRLVNRRVASLKKDEIERKVDRGDEKSSVKKNGSFKEQREEINREFVERVNMGDSINGDKHEDNNKNDDEDDEIDDEEDDNDEEFNRYTVKKGGETHNDEEDYSNLDDYYFKENKLINNKINDKSRNKSDSDDHNNNRNNNHNDNRNNNYNNNRNYNYNNNINNNMADSYDVEFERIKESFSAKNIAMMIIASTAVIATLILFLILLICCHQRHKRKQTSYDNNNNEKNSKKKFNKRCVKCKDQNGCVYYTTYAISPQILQEQETVSDVVSTYKDSDVISPICLNYPEDTVCADSEVEGNFDAAKKNFKIFNNNPKNTYNNPNNTYNISNNTYKNSNSTFMDGLKQYNENNYDHNNYSSNNNIKKANSLHRISLSSSISKVNHPPNHCNSPNPCNSPSHIKPLSPINANCNNAIPNNGNCNNAIYNNGNCNNGLHSNVSPTFSLNTSKKTNTYRWEDI